MNENECKECRMKFESSEQMANHIKRFCVNSEFGNLKQLDIKYETAIKPKYPELKPTGNGSQLKSYGGFTLDQVKSNMKSNDDDFKKLENAVLRKREDEMLDEIKVMKNERAQMRVVTDQDEQVFQELLQEIELKKEREFQCRVEKEQMRKLINEIDSWRMSTMEEQKKGLLEKLLLDREELKNKQMQLIEDIRNFIRGHRSFHQLEQNSKVMDNKVITSAQYSDLKQQLVKLQTRREYYEQERMKILDNVERLKLGDLGEVRRGESSRVRNTPIVGVDNTQIQHYDDIVRMKDKIAADSLRLEALKREQMDRADKLRPQSNYSEKVVSDLHRLKQDYEQAGGQDPKFIQNVNNIGEFYKQSQNNPIYQPPQPQQQQPQSQIIQPMQPMIGFNQDNNQQPPKKKKVDLNDPFDSFSRKKEFFLQNNVRGVDLTREEQMLVNLESQEVDALRVISRVPVGTEIYRFKMEQYKELSTMRAEMEKIIQEQRLQRLRRNFEKKRRVQDKEYENNKWVDDNRKFIIDNRLRVDFGETKAEQHLYDGAEGFVIHFDYCLGLPRRTKLCQFVYAIYNNMQSLYAPKLIEPLDCEIESELSNRVLIGDSMQVYEIPPHPEVLLIVEIQFPVSKKLEENLGKTESYAWTHLDIFDQQRQLKRGKFKCPLYIGPTDPTITVEEIAKLEPIPNAWLHLRITYPNDEDFDQVRSIYPEQTAQEYNIPYIHLKGLFARNYEASIQGKGQDGGNGVGIGVGSGGGVQDQSITMNGQNYKVTEEVQVFNRGNNDRRRTPQDKSFVLKNNLNKKKGIRVIIHQIQNHVANNLLRVMSAALVNSQLMLDQQGFPIAFNTTVHDPSSSVASQAMENDPVPLVEADPQMAGISNKAARSILIQFHEEYRIFYDLQDIAMKQKKPILLGFQVMEKSAQQQQVNQSLTLGDYDPIGWRYIDLVRADGSVQVGRNMIKMYNPPLKRPPLDMAQISESGIKLEYAVYDFEYNDEDILKWRNSRRF